MSNSAASMPQRYVGTSVERSEDQRILTGTGIYVDDIVLPGMLHATFVRSPFAHARILSIDTSEAEAVPGVHAVLDGEAMKALLAADAPTLGVFGVPPMQS